MRRNQLEHIIRAAATIADDDDDDDDDTVVIGSQSIITAIIERNFSIPSGAS